MSILGMVAGVFALAVIAAVLTLLVRHALSKTPPTYDPLKGWPLQVEGSSIYYRMPDGSIRSRKRDYRRLLCQVKGIETGRQWVRLRKSLPKALRLFTHN